MTYIHLLHILRRSHDMIDIILYNLALTL